MGDFFTSQNRTARINTPRISAHATCFIIVIYSASRFYKQKAFKRIFQGLQIVQLVLLYGWYMATQAPLTESLPFIIAGLLCLQSCSCQGEHLINNTLPCWGCLDRFVPCFIQFLILTRFHITLFSYLVGHLALLGNSIVYLMNEYDYKILSNRRIIEITFGMNTVNYHVNQLTGGDYGSSKILL